jgi:hypothetical protein
MQPSEFWRLPICDFWAELDQKIDEARKIKEMTEGAKSKTGIVFSREQWEAARRKHAEKMKAKK